MSLSPLLDRLAIGWFGLIGLVVGSFLNVVIYRLPRGYLLSLPRRSVCANCKKQIRGYENIPIISYLFLGGRCGGCQISIGVRHPFVEALTAVLFVAIYLHFGFSVLTVYYAFFAAALIAVTFIDLDFRIIPDRISILGMVLGLIGAMIHPALSASSHVLGLLFGGGVFWLFSFLYLKWTGRDGLGFGDVKLLAMIGAFLGLQGAIGTLLASSVIGSIVGLSLMFIQKKDLKMAIPFGPFLAIGALIMLFWGDSFVLRFYSGE